MTASITLSPPFRWPGGKRGLLNELLAYCPPTFQRYYEPFVGGGALFFRLQPSDAVLSDHNADLINFYQVLRDEPDAFRAALSVLSTDERTYYSVRRHSPIHHVQRAARFAYLSTLSFNGIYRVNRQGRFNVPYGQRRYPSLNNAPWIDTLSQALKGAELRTSDFEPVAGAARSGDLVYFDPPYTVALARNGFLRYNERIYSYGDQARLARLARSLADRGCHVLISNAHHESLLSLYPDFRAVVLTRPSRIAASVDRRVDVTEYLFVAN